MVLDFPHFFAMRNDGAYFVVAHSPFRLPSVDSTDVGAKNIFSFISSVLLPLPRRLCFRRLFVCLFVCLLATLRKNF